MLNVLSCIQERENHIFFKNNNDEWIDEIISSELQDEVFFITPEGFANMYSQKQREELLSKYHLAGIFELGNPYINTKVGMVLVYIVAKEKPTVKISVYSGDVYDKKKCKRTYLYDLREWGIPGEYLPEFNEYIKKIENWINECKAPELNGDEKFEFNEIAVQDIDPDQYYPRYYTKKAIELRNLAKREQFLKLSDVADILSSGKVKDSQEIVKILKPSNFSYPLDVNSLDVGTPTKILLQKGDIVYATIGKKGCVYLYNESSDVPVYASSSEAVIRCIDVLPEYLYLYLNSEVAKQLCSIATKGQYIERISIRDLRNLPVARPVQSDEKYKRDFRLLTAVKTRDYKDYGRDGKLQSYNDYLKELQEKEKRPEKVEDILDLEIANSIKVNNEEQLRSFLTDDLKELNTCFAHGAYKATLILAGSILEAVLIDWLSEIDGKDYFDEEYIVVDRKTGKTKHHAELLDYIDAIKEIQRPKWMKEANEAHEIRKKRNLVHAKLGINAKDVNEKTCREVVQYLKDVIKTRGVS